MSLNLLIDDEKGVWHLSNEGQVTWSDFAQNIAERGKLNKDLLTPVTQQQMRFKAQRPAYSVLSSNKGIKLPLLDNALDRFFSEKSVFVPDNI
jgi:dTDP-4-dehydrorhamnose reductase